MASTDKPTVRTTVTLESDLREWIDGRAARSRREFSAELNAVIEEVRDGSSGRGRLLNFKVDDDVAARIEAVAKSVPYRTLSAYMREVILADVDRVERGEAAAPRQPMPSDS